MRALEYKGYQGTAEVDLETGVIVGKILFVSDLVTYEASSVPEIQQEFQLAVDDYLETCRQLGRDPQVPFSGVFNVRVGPDLHRAAASRAQKEGLKLNALVVKALEQYLLDPTIRHTHTHTHDHQVVVRMDSSMAVKSVEPRSYGAGQWEPLQTTGAPAHVSH